MKRFYWLFAGALVGVGTIVMSVMIVTVVTGLTVDTTTIDSLNWPGQIGVVVAYAIVIYLLSLGEKILFKNKK